MSIWKKINTFGLATSLLLSQSNSFTSEVMQYFGESEYTDEAATTESIIDHYKQNTLNTIDLSKALTEEDYSKLLDIYNSRLLQMDKDIYTITLDLKYLKSEMMAYNDKPLKYIKKIDNMYRIKLKERNNIVSEREGIYNSFETSEEVKKILDQLKVKLPKTENPHFLEIGTYIGSFPVGENLDVVKPYGISYNFKENKLQFNKSVTLRAPRGSDIKAVYGGFEIINEKDTLILYHGDSVVTTYKGLNLTRFEFPTQTTQGSVLAKSDGTDLKVSMYLNGNSVNITKAMKQKEEK